MRNFIIFQGLVKFSCGTSFPMRQAFDPYDVKVNSSSSSSNNNNNNNNNNKNNNKNNNNNINSNNNNTINSNNNNNKNNTHTLSAESPTDLCGKKTTKIQVDWYCRFWCHWFSTGFTHLKLLLKLDLIAFKAPCWKSIWDPWRWYTSDVHWKQSESSELPNPMAPSKKTHFIQIT